MADITTHSTHRIYLKQGGGVDDHLKRVVLAGLRALHDDPVPDNANVTIEDEGKMVIVVWSTPT